MSAPYPWIKDSQYLTSPVTGYLAVTSTNGLYLNSTTSTVLLSNTSDKVEFTPTNLNYTPNGGTSSTATWASVIAGGGGSGVTTVSAGTNISVTGTSTIPIVNLSNPLSAVLNLGTQNITGTSGNMTLTNTPSTSKSTISATSIEVADTSVTTTKSSLAEGGLIVQTSASSVAITPTTLTKTGTAPLVITSASGATITATNSNVSISASLGSMTLSSASTTNITALTGSITISGGGGGGGGIILAQASGANTTLTTNIANVNYYPDFVITNQNSNNVGVPQSSVVYQRLTLINLGLTDNNLWVNWGSAIFSGYSAMFRDTYGNIWLAQQGSGTVDIYNETIDTLKQTFSFGNNGNTTEINCFYQVSDYVFVGGMFTSVNGNATSQNSIARIYLAAGGTYYEDPAYDGSLYIFGVEDNTTVYSITFDQGGSGGFGTLIYGGNFTRLSNGAPCGFIGAMNNCLASSGAQSYNEYEGGVNGKVYAVLYYNNFLWAGGDFNVVGVNTFSQNLNYCSAFGGGSWQQVASNGISATVFEIQQTSYGYVWLGGSFGQIYGSGQNYNTYIDQNNPNTFQDTFLNASNGITYKSTHYSTFGVLGVIDSGSLHVSSNYQAWTNFGPPSGSGNITGVNFFASNWKVCYDGDSSVKTHTILPHSCAFSGVYKYDNTTYANYTITQRDVSQQFIGISGAWSIIGAGVGSFS